MKNKAWVYRTSNESINIIAKKHLAYELVESIVFFLIMYNVISMFYYYDIMKRTEIYKGLLAIIPLAVTVTLKRKIQKNSINDLATVIMLVFTCFFEIFLTGNREFSVVCTTVLFIATLRTKKALYGFYSINILIISELVLAVFLVMTSYFAANFRVDFSFMVSFTTIVSIAIALLCTIYVYASRSSRIIDRELKGESYTVRRLKKIKFFFPMMFGAINTALLWLCWKAGLFSLIDSLTKYKEPDAKEVSKASRFVREEITDSRNSVGGLSDFITDREHSMFLYILTILVFAILACIIFMAIYFFIKFAIRWIKGRLKGKRSKVKNEKVEALISVEEITDNISAKGKKLTKYISGRGNISEREQIRKAYYKLALSFKGTGIIPQKSETSLEIGNKIKGLTGRDIEEATKIYRKARYSMETCTTEDVEKMKEIQKNTH